VAISLILDLYGVSFYEILKWLIGSAMREASRKKRLLQPKLSEVVTT
jgi:hypothetical protein